MKKSLFLAMPVLLTAFAAHADVSIDEDNLRFSDDAIKIWAGETVAFTNKDKVTYNIQIMNAAGDTDDKGLQKPGEIVRETFSEPGEYTVHCGIHSTARMRITVAPKGGMKIK